MAPDLTAGAGLNHLHVINSWKNIERMPVIFFLISILACFTCAHAQQKNLPKIGVVQNIENDSLLKASGFQFVVESTSKILSPRTVTDEQFEKHLAKIKGAEISLYACNIFLPSDLKVVGPTIDEAAVFKYAETVFHRARKAGITMIVWGSSGSRRIPDGFDKERAKQQFIYMAKGIAKIASKYSIILALENLNRSEANFITTVEEALEIVKAVNHKNLKLCTDIYHMLKENETPGIIEKAKGYVVYCEVAEKEGRTPPGVNGENFEPYFMALKKIGFKGRVSIECHWDDIFRQGPSAYRELDRQLREVF